MRPSDPIAMATAITSRERFVSGGVFWTNEGKSRSSRVHQHAAAAAAEDEDEEGQEEEES